VRAPEARGGPPLARELARHGGVRPGSRRDLASPKDGASPCSVGPVRACQLLRKQAARGSSPRSPPRGGGLRRTFAGGQSALRGGRGSRARGRCPCIVLFAEIVRTPSGSGKRATGDGAGRKPAPSAERVNGSLALRGKTTDARAYAARGAKRGRFVGARRSSSREHRAIDEDGVTLSHLGAGAVRAAAGDGRHLRSGKRTPFTRPPRNVWRWNGF
jgi:hypothetical protein